MRFFFWFIVPAAALACAPSAPTVAPRAPTVAPRAPDVRTSEGPVGVEAPVITAYRSRLDGRMAVSLGSSLVPFAHYINAIHHALHPHFTNDFLESTGPLNQDIHATAEIVVDGRTGDLIQSGIVTSSGHSEFDRGVERSLKATFPVQPVPDAILSADGLVYIQWQFWSDPRYACSTYFARPYLLGEDAQQGDDGFVVPPTHGDMGEKLFENTKRNQ